jgi:hypothetical protein
VNQGASDQQDPPVLLAKRKGGLLVVQCPHCEREHRHGTGAGHRQAHCTRPDSPYRLSGYLLKVVPKLDQRGHLGHLTVKGFTT